MTTESTILARIRRALGRRPDVRLFRNPVGTAWVGRLLYQSDDRVTLDRAHRIECGLFPGSGDLIGWQTIQITPDMVGRHVAVFTSIEVKTRRGRMREGQLTWLSNVAQAGGNAGIARSPEDARTILDTYEPE